jgi:hypothetical protein
MINGLHPAFDLQLSCMKALDMFKKGKVYSTTH